MARAVYCKCKNTYSINCGKGNKKCNTPYYWSQGIGSISKTETQISTYRSNDAVSQSFDNTFGDTFKNIDNNNAINYIFDNTFNNTFK